LGSTGTNASGRTAKSLRVEPTEFGVVVYGRRYFKGVEIGRGAGGVPNGFNQIIKDWIVNKGISIKQIPYKRQSSDKWKPKYSVPERSLNLMAGAIVQGIRTKGTKLHQTGGRADIYSNELPIAIANIKKRVSFEIIQQIKLNIAK